MKRLQSENGNTLVTVLVSTLISGGLALAVASLMGNQSQQIKVIQQKNQALDLKNQMIFSFKDETICGCNLNPSKSAATADIDPASFDGNIQDGSAVLDLGTTGFREGCALDSNLFLPVGAPLPNGLQVASIKVKDLRPADGTTLQWNGHLNVSWVQPTDNSQMPIKDIQLPIQITVDSSSPVATRVVDSCTLLGKYKAAAAASPDCPAFMNKIGTDNRSFCIDKTVRTKLGAAQSRNKCAQLATDGFGPARLCTYAEWNAACNFFGETAAHVSIMTGGKAERSDDDPGGGYMLDIGYFSSKCNEIKGNYEYSQYPFRCCIK